MNAQSGRPGGEGRNAGRPGGAVNAGRNAVNAGRNAVNAGRAGGVNTNAGRPGAKQNAKSGSKSAKAKAQRRARLYLFCLILFVMAALVILIFEINLRYTAGGDDIKLYLMLERDYDPEKTRATKTLGYEEVFIDGDMYVDFSLIAETFDLTVTGDRREIRYISDDVTGEYMTVSPGSSEIVINGRHARLASEVRRSGDRILVPAELVQSYVRAINVTYDKEANKLFVLRSYKYDTQGRPVGETIGFTLRSDTPLGLIDEYSLPEDILNRTYYVNQTQTDVASSDNGGEGN